MDNVRSSKAGLRGPSPQRRMSPNSAARLRDEIAALEKRLAQIGPDGDCGYENAMIRFFEQQLGERRASLRDAERQSTSRGRMPDRI